MKTEVIADLYDRVLNLQYMAAKKELDQILLDSGRRRGKSQQPLKGSRPAGRSDGWTLTTTMDPKTRRKKYELRSADGSVRQLSSDVSTWPQEIREMEEQWAAVDRARTYSGRIVSNFIPPQEKGK